MNQKQVFNILIRYIILLLIPIGNLFILSAIFTPLTVFPSYWILSLIYPNSALISYNSFSLNGTSISLIPACIALAAYYLLLILNLSMPLNLKKRIKSLLFILVIFLILNIIRIIVFSILAVNKYQYFNITHEITWYFGSTILLIIIWFGSVKLFNIKSIPIYTDLSQIYKDIIKKPKMLPKKSKGRSK